MKEETQVTQCRKIEFTAQEMRELLFLNQYDGDITDVVWNVVKKSLTVHLRKYETFNRTEEIDSCGR